MPWISAGLAVGSSLLGARSSRRARRQAEADANARREDAERTRQLGRDYSAWFDGEYDRTRASREGGVARADEVSDAQYGGMQYSMQQAREAEARRKGIFEPLEDKIVTEALQFNDAARGEELAGQASADLTQAASDARGQTQRSLQRVGVAPGSGAYAATLGQQNIQQALGQTQVQNQARRQARDEGYMRRMNAVQLGAGLRGAQATQQQLATGQGGAAVSAAGAGANIDLSGAGLKQQGFGGMMQAFGQGNNSNQIANQNQQTANHWGQQQTAAYGSALGGMADMFAGTRVGNTGGGISVPSVSTPGVSGIGLPPSFGTDVPLAPTFGTSDKNKKKNTGKPADTVEALDELMAVPIHEDWEYDESKGAPAGSGGKKHTGPMAQDVRKHMGEKAAPRGEVIDFIEVNGKLMASMQELAKRVKKLEAHA